MFFEEPIAALATPPGQGGIAIIRVSGEGAEEILKKVFRPAGRKFPLPSHLMVYGHLFRGNETLDECMAVVMRAPRSYTREDVCELHIHGGSIIAKDALEAILAAGARLAQPGEFTRRAFCNGRVDLSRAEAVMGMITASSHRAARAAARQLEGGVSAFIGKARQDLTAMLAGLEAAVDYPEEIDEEEATRNLRAGIDALAAALDSAVNERGARITRTGLEVVLCGCPNVGKSSLMNALLGEDKAIVTSVPGTTRDILTGSMELDGFAVNLKDTAGLHESADEVESIGIARARKAVFAADLVLLLIDGSRPLTEEDQVLIVETASCPRVVLLTKADLPAAVTRQELSILCGDSPVLSVSSGTGAGLDALKTEMARRAAAAGESVLTLSRHLDAARRAAASLRAAGDAIDAGMPLDMAAIDLHTAMDALCEITGENPTESLLDDVFSRFCVGK